MVTKIRAGESNKGIFEIKNKLASTINPPINDTQKDELVQITRVRNESLQGKKKRKENIGFEFLCFFLPLI
jgi:hypothetical protein